MRFGHTFNSYRNLKEPIKLSLTIESTLLLRRRVVLLPLFIRSNHIHVHVSRSAAGLPDPIGGIGLIFLQFLAY